MNVESILDVSCQHAVRSRIMLKADVLSLYEGSSTKAARALGFTRSAIDQWGPIVPLASAILIEERLKGRLKRKKKLYNGRKTIIPSKAMERRHAVA